MTDAERGLDECITKGEPITIRNYDGNVLVRAARADITKFFFDATVAGGKLDTDFDWDEFHRRFGEVDDDTIEAAASAAALLWISEQKKAGVAEDDLIPP